MPNPPSNRPLTAAEVEQEATWPYIPPRQVFYNLDNESTPSESTMSTSATETILISTTCALHLMHVNNTTYQNNRPNPFPIDADWWWIYERLYRNSDMAEGFADSYCRRNPISNIQNFIEVYRRLSPDERLRHYGEMSYGWRNASGDNLQEYQELNTKTFRVAARSLLYLLKRLKKEGADLVHDTNATYWVWFNKSLNWMAQTKVNKLNNNERASMSGEFGDTALTLMKQKLLDRFAKSTGIHLVVDSGGMNRYLLRSEAKSYWLQYGLFWRSIDKWEVLKNTQSIVWCPEVKEWVHRSALIQVCEKTTTVHTIPKAYIPQTKKWYATCPKCEEWWKVGDLTENKWVEAKICPSCHPKFTKALINPNHNFQSIFSGYHTHRTWNFINQRLYDGDEHDLPIGVEVEMAVKSGLPDDVPPLMWHLYEYQLAHNPKWHNFYSETDGSLADCGVEMITNPMTRAFHQKYWEVMLPEMRKNLIGWNATEKGGASYGIHLTFHRKYWRDYHLARLIKFLEDADNQNFVYALAQRRIMYGGGSVANKVRPKLTEATRVINGKLHSSDRGNAVYLKLNQLVEIRMFASTLNQESFLKNIEFLDSFHHWCKDTAFSTHYGEYLVWLFNNRKHEKAYPNLIQYVQRKKFGCKNGDPVKNTWKTCILTKPLGQLDLFHETPVQQEVEDRIDVSNS